MCYPTGMAVSRMPVLTDTRRAELNRLLMIAARRWDPRAALIDTALVLELDGKQHRIEVANLVEQCARSADLRATVEHWYDAMDEVLGVSAAGRASSSTASMRNDELIFARLVAVLAVVVGLVGGIALCGYAFFHSGVSGLGYQISYARDTMLLDLALVGGGGLAAIGSVALLLLPRATHEARPRPSTPALHRG